MWAAASPRTTWCNFSKRSPLHFYAQAVEYNDRIMALIVNGLNVMRLQRRYIDR